MKRLSDLVFAAVARLLPPDLRSWGLAAAHEAQTLARPGEALRFALGCLVWAIGAAIRFRISSFRRQGEALMDLINGPGPRGAAILCGVGAISLGLAYMAAAGAPLGYLLINAGALAFGLVVLGILALADERGHLLAGPINLLLGLALLAVSVWGVSAGGVTRWAAVGPLVLQPSFMVLPLMAVLFARSRDTLSLAGLVVAALALALQPDRGMAGALAAGLSLLALIRPDRRTIAAAAAVLVGLGATLAQPDRSPAMPFVDQILYSAFALHPLAGVAVVLGSVLLVLPVLAARRANRPEAPAYLVFGAFWAGIILAAALGNYPTPLVGYGGSSIVGYLLGLVVFARRVPETASAAVEPAPERGSEEPLHFAPLT